jgi:Fur family ferric uptake transcriptional regulator
MLQGAPVERDTAQRRAIRRVFQQTARPLSPNEILMRARRDIPRMGLATVYRTLKSLCDDGTLVPVDAPGETRRYETAGKAHHHHFSCRACGRMFEVEGCPSGITRMVPRGFLLERHELTLVGRCRDCAGRS